MPADFQSRQEAFRAGLQQAMGAPIWVLFAGMIGFGAMANTLGFNVWLATLTSLLVFALPGQVVLLEMLSTGAAPLTHNGPFRSGVRCPAARAPLYTATFCDRPAANALMLSNAVPKYNS